MFQSFLKQHDAAAWQRTLEALLPDIHDVDRDATQIWFHFFPLELAEAIAESGDLAQLATDASAGGQLSVSPIKSTRAIGFSTAIGTGRR